MIEFPYEIDENFVGPFYDYKVTTIIGTTYSTFENAKTACTANAACNSVLFI